jgi:hypothetical protein
MEWKMKLTELQKYKHDTIGKFQVLKEMIESIKEGDLASPDAMEILEAADEVYQTMVKSSKKILEHLQK